MSSRTLKFTRSDILSSVSDFRLISVYLLIVAITCVRLLTDHPSDTVGTIQAKINCRINY